MLFHENAKLDHVFVILRYDAYMVEEFGMKTDYIYARKIVHSEEIASREVERLNRINGHKGVVYFRQSARLDRDLRVVDDAELIAPQINRDVTANHQA